MNRLSEVCRGQAIFEGVRVVDEDDRDFRAVAPLEFGVGEDVNFLEGVLAGAGGTLNLALGFVAEMTAGFSVEKDVRFLCHGLKRLAVVCKKNRC